MKYYINKHVPLEFNETVAKAREELKKEGFGVLTEIDVKATLKEKLNVGFQDYIILGACNPPSAYKALQCEDKIGVMLPCNVIVQGTLDGGTEVSAIDPVAAMGAIENPELVALAIEIRDKLARVIESM